MYAVGGLACQLVMMEAVCGDVYTCLTMEF
jgi:hypothetical protein